MILNIPVGVKEPMALTSFQKCKKLKSKAWVALIDLQEMLPKGEVNVLSYVSAAIGEIQDIDCKPLK